MGPLKVCFFGSGDAFGSGGRLQSCVMVQTEESGLLIDCGATALSGMKRQGIDSSAVDTILISHLHGDHFCGLPFLIKEIQVAGARDRALIIAGPEDLEPRVEGLLKLLFPGSEDIRSGFWPDFLVLSVGEPRQIGDVRVAAYPAAHSPKAHPLSLRIDCRDTVIAYSGDTEWSDMVPEVSRDADLFICETYEYRHMTGNHLNYLTLLDHRHELDCRRIVLTHLGDTMIEKCGFLEFECAHDGMVIEV
ncbi:MAG: MBL fold metallo-hydrolase [Deltaproteobacteria bacterium]|jgi:ribonuclease BN (tRNA processing enzyme)|nr:MBL fold metallo-hydrolase [Deltaproteobacteria bacterium]MDX9761248.1 MBL fold metallo-hydrolase [Desulfomonilia bacterium]